MLLSLVMSVKYCSNCGTELPAKSTFCPNCGKQITQSKQKRAPKVKLNRWLAIGTLILWMVVASMIIAESSISRVERQCGLSFVSGADCVPRSVAEFNLLQPGIIVGMLITALVVYMVYRLWINEQKINKTRVVLVSILSLLILILSIATAFAGERQNDHNVLSTAEKNCVDRHSIDDYIARGTFGCGENVDARFNMTFDELAANKNESGGLLIFYWIVYGGLLLLIVLRPSKTKNESA